MLMMKNCVVMRTGYQKSKCGRRRSNINDFSNLRVHVFSFFFVGLVFFFMLLPKVGTKAPAVRKNKGEVEGNFFFLSGRQHWSFLVTYRGPRLR